MPRSPPAGTFACFCGPLRCRVHLMADPRPSLRACAHGRSRDAAKLEAGARKYWGRNEMRGRRFAVPVHESRSIGRRRVSMEARKSGGLRMGGQGRTSSATGDVRTHPDTLHPGRRGLCARVSCSACCGLEHDMSQHSGIMWPGGSRIPTTLRLESCGLTETGFSTTFS